MNVKESGIMLPIFSLPGKYGIGTLGKNAYYFIDFLKESGFSYWEILPIFATGYSNSPFQVISVFGFNYYLIDLELLEDEGLLFSRDLKDIDFGDSRKKIDYDKLYAYKRNVLYLAFKRFNKEDNEFIEFKKDPHISNFVLYSTIKYLNKDKAWFDFALEDRYFNSEIEEDYKKRESKLIDFFYFIQFIFYKQWINLKKYANDNNIKIIGDLPHFLGYDSDSVYLHPEIFLVDKRNLVTSVAGFPPDEFKKEGQKWGYPLYDWDYLKLRGYKWWNTRISKGLLMFDKIKLNHFRGFYEVYAIPFRSKNAKKGKFIEVPGYDFIKSLDLNDKLIASCLGTYDKEIAEFAKKCEIPELHVVLPNLFNKDKFIEELLPTNIESNSYVYLENHDHLAFKGMIENSSKEEIEFARFKIFEEARKLNIEFKEDISNYELSYLLIEILFKSDIEHVTLTLQDILFLGSESRINTPGKESKNNWSFRILKSELTNSIKENLRKINLKYDRFNIKNK